jgi:hypothetical protein
MLTEHAGITPDMMPGVFHWILIVRPFPICLKSKAPIRTHVKCMRL